MLPVPRDLMVYRSKVSFALATQIQTAFFEKAGLQAVLMWREKFQRVESGTLIIRISSHWRCTQECKVRLEVGQHACNQAQEVRECWGHVQAWHTSPTPFHLSAQGCMLCLFSPFWWP